MIQTYFPPTTSKEYLLASEEGAYAASTISGCNTRKYHGMLVVPQPQIDDDHHVLLSAVDETIRYKEEVFRLGTHCYPGVTDPEGFKLIKSFRADPIPQWKYQVGDAVLLKELLLEEQENRLFIRYTLEKAREEMTLNLQPFLAFRNMHTLSRANKEIDQSVEEITSGIKIRLYPQYDSLYLQLSGGASFQEKPDWYYQVAYQEEQNRGYDFREDLYVPGHFTVTLRKGGQVILSAGLKEGFPDTFETEFARMLGRKPRLQTIHEYLQNAARQFIIKKEDGTQVKAGYYWFGSWGRDTCIALPGLTLLTGDIQSFKDILSSLLADLKEGLLPNAGAGEQAAYNSVDAPLWLVWALQQYAICYRAEEEIWLEYGEQLRSILDHYREGTRYHIKMDDDGLIQAGAEGLALTWMDAVVNGQPVTPRTGKPVEVNALWYNAVCFCLQAARSAGDRAFVKEWDHEPARIRESFVIRFWDEDKKYLADCVGPADTDWSLRPNQLLAVSLPFSPLPDELKKHVLDMVREELLTPKGLRTLSPGDTRYRGQCSGDQASRDRAYHQGTVWPWLLGHFTEASLKVYHAAALSQLEDIYAGIAESMQEFCLYTLPEIYDGDEPHKARGAVAQAWSVAEVIRMHDLIGKFRKSIDLPRKEFKIESRLKSEVS